MEDQILTLLCLEADAHRGLTRGKQYKGNVCDINVQDSIAFIYVKNDSLRLVNVRLGRFSVKLISKISI